VDAPSDVLAEICAFIGLSFDEAMLRYFDRADNTHRGMDESGRRYNPHVQSPPTAGLRSWERQMDRAQVVAFEAIAGDALEEFHYPTTVGSFTMRQAVRAKRAELGFQVRRARRRVLRGRKAPGRPAGSDGHDPNLPRLGAEDMEAR